MKNCRKTSRRGFSLLELLVTTTMLATLTASCMVLVRTSYTAWNRHKDDHSQRLAGKAVLQHVVRKIRQAKAITAISLASETSGSLTLLDAEGNILAWGHDAGSKEARYGITTANNVLATGIEELQFEGFKADGTTPTTEPGLIHSVLCTTKINLVRPAGTESVTTSCQAWLRAW